MRKRAVTLGMMLLLGFGVAVATTGAQEQAKQEQAKRELTDEQRAEAEVLLKVLDQAMAGEPAPSDVSLEWQNDFLKAQEGRTYVPFTIGMDAAQISGPIVMYVRVNERQGAAQAAGEENREQAEKSDRPTYAFEDVHFIDDLAAADGQTRVSRAFAVPAGEYDVYVAIKEDTGGEERSDDPATIAVLRQSVIVPDFWTGELTTSSVILAERVEPAQPLTEEEQAANPYTLGTTRIVPNPNANYGKQDELSVIFLIYNPGLAENKPDVSVEYNFHQETPEGEKYFNKTNPQQFNAQTLPPQFDMAAGHQLVAGQSVPLTSFPEGDYRLEIKVTDNTSGQSVTRDVRFNVAAS